MNSEGLRLASCVVLCFLVGLCSAEQPETPPAPSRKDLLTQSLQVVCTSADDFMSKTVAEHRLLVSISGHAKKDRIGKDLLALFAAVKALPIKNEQNLGKLKGETVDPEMSRVLEKVEPARLAKLTKLDWLLSLAQMLTAAEPDGYKGVISPLLLDTIGADGASSGRQGWAAGILARGFSHGDLAGDALRTLHELAKRDELDKDFRRVLLGSLGALGSQETMAMLGSLRKKETDHKIQATIERATYRLAYGLEGERAKKIAILKSAISESNAYLSKDWALDEIVQGKYVSLLEFLVSAKSKALKAGATEKTFEVKELEKTISKLKEIRRRSTP